MFWNSLILTDLFLFWLVEISIIIFLINTIPIINLSILISSILNVLNWYSFISWIFSGPCRSQSCLLILDILTRTPIISISYRNYLTSTNRQQHLKRNNRILLFFCIIFMYLAASFNKICNEFIFRCTAFYHQNTKVFC